MKRSHGTSTFQITFTRWDKQKCTRRRKIVHQQAADFEDAYEYATTMMRAYGDVDSAREYEIEGIKYTGMTADDDASIGWQSSEEWQAANPDAD